MILVYTIFRTLSINKYDFFNFFYLHIQFIVVSYSKQNKTEVFLLEVEEKLKEMMEIKSGNVRNFSIENEIPYTTVRSILERGVLNAKAETVFAICRALNISPETLVDGDFSKSNNIILGDNHGVNSLTGGNGNTNTYNFGANDNINNHTESMKALSVADVKMSRALLNAQNETVKKLDRVIELLEEQNRISKEIKK